jgi:putative glutamine amidotransferase
MQLTIGITATEARYENYPLWIKASSPDIQIIELSPANSNELEKCDGIVLSGGIDTHPTFYKNERINYPLAPKEFNVARDEFELHVFKTAQEKNIPVLAICRGMQLVNVALGGNLIQDIEEGGKPDHRRHSDVDGVHTITVVEKSLLHEISTVQSGTINSAHHQALNKIADDLIVTAVSPDNTAEAAEWKNKTGKPFLLCVQWHPERLAQEQPDNPFTKNIRTEFLKAITQKKLNSKS